MSSSVPPIRWPRVAAAVAAVAALAVAWIGWTWWSADRALDQQQVDAISDRGTEDPALAEALDVLVVGSDDRADLTEEQRRELRTGDFDGTRTDTILWVQLRQDGVSIVSFPRDLRVLTSDGGSVRINRVLELGGPDALAATVEGLIGAELDHYVEVSISSFLEIVDAAGGVEVCLDEPLQDRKSGADFTAGCHDMDGVDALAYVRSRQGARSDFERVERQQRFLSALADRTTSLAVLGNPVRLRSVATTVADGLTVDDGLGVPRMVELARAMRGVLEDGLDTITLPASPEDIDGIPYVVPYTPGLAMVAGRIQRAEPLPERPSAEDRDELTVLIRSGGDADQAAEVESVLFFAGYDVVVDGAADDPPLRTRVHAGPGAEQAAAAIALITGGEVARSGGDEPLAVGTVLVELGTRTP